MSQFTKCTIPMETIQGRAVYRTTGTRQQRTPRTGTCRHHSIISRYRNWTFGIVAILLLICCFSLLVSKTVSSASVQMPKEKCYTSVQIEAGDSLWSIAKQYYTEDWEDLDSFIEEIKSFNGISSDRIHAGNYLAIPYYDVP